jgi:hypothetical protein
VPIGVNLCGSVSNCLLRKAALFFGSPIHDSRFDLRRFYTGKTRRRAAKSKSECPSCDCRQILLRGMHLTPVLAKIASRSIQSSPCLSSSATDVGVTPLIAGALPRLEPNNGAVGYETKIKADRFVVMIHG